MTKRLMILALLLAVPCHAAHEIQHVELGEDGVILRVDLYDYANPKVCPSADVDNTDVSIVVSTDKSSSSTTYSGGTLNAITTLGTFEATTEAHFEVVTTGGCWYEIQLPNTSYEVAGSTMLTLTVDGGGANIIDGNFWVDLTPISAPNLIDQLLDTDCSSYVTDNDVGYQVCTAIDAIAGALTTVDSIVDAILRQTTRVGKPYLNCEVNTANFAGDTLNFACILTDIDDNPVTKASNDLEGSLIVVTSGDQIDEQRYINNTVWDAGNSELQISLSRALPGALADADTVVIR